MTVKVDFFERKQSEIGVALNEVQQQVVRQTDGPVLLLASPGSGKTTTIIMRIGYLIEERAVHPAKIKAVTFSKAAANDMLDRFKRLFPDLEPVDFSTIHSLAYEVMRDYLRKRNTAFHIIEGEHENKERWEVTEGQYLPLNKKMILRHLYKTVVGDSITDDQLDELTTYISYIKNKMVTEVELAKVRVDVPQAERIFREYESFKRAEAQRILVDFDDMLVIAYEALQQDNMILSKYQQQYHYFLTDESQDTSLVQHAIVEYLVAKHHNLCVVADDDQSIYSWRGAEPSYLLAFQTTYPQAVILYLEQNYRSTTDIVHVANQFIKRNKTRYNKNMFTTNPSAEPIKLVTVADDRAQTSYVIEEIRKQTDLSEVAILYRNNTSSIPLMNAFDRAGIPFYMKDADNRFFSHWVVEDILNFMRMTFTDKRADILEKIHMKFNGYISKQQMTAVKAIQNGESVFDNLLQHVSLQDYQHKQIEKSKETFQQMKGMPPLHAIQVIRERLGYDKVIEKMCERLGFRKDYLLGILSTLEEIASSLTTMEQFAARLKYLERELKSAKFRKGQNAVTFSTLHSAKGLEFEQVYMIDLIENIIPAKRESQNELEMEEATRLFYVGMTRAKRNLTLLTYEKQDGEKLEESIFVTAVRNIMFPSSAAHSNSSLRQTVKVIDTTAATIPAPGAIMDKELLKVGQLINHRVFGQGKITEMDDASIEIRFKQEVKRLSLSICLDRGILEEISD
ncbi:ATP-dependent helicase [Paenibacillus yanchengensis]|uniref:DNA 3'-5' helicase n=1 Tax=Paenibacillus yanchengensis TaxID=2035833 RepID=A0ABW4YET4_9BACL